MTSLRGYFERPQRFDLIVEQFDSHWPQPVERENIENAAAMRKLARQLDGARRMKAALDEPSQERINVDPLALAEDARRRGNRLKFWRRLEQGLDRGDEGPRCRERPPWRSFIGRSDIRLV
jgi:hypothetical protein